MAKRKLLMVACTVLMALGITLSACGDEGGNATTSDAVTEETTASDAMEEDTVRTGIIGAMDEEVATLKDEMTDVQVERRARTDFYVGKLDGKDVVVVKCNIGKVNAAICSQILIDEFGVDRVINTGVAGSLDARLDIGEIVVSTDVVQHDYDLTPVGAAPGEFIDFDLVDFPADEQMREATIAAVREVAPDVETIEGRVCTGDQFVASQEQKDRITEDFGGLCCEMEGGAIAQTCFLNDVPFVVIRAISDKADGSASVDYAEFEKEAAANCAAITRRMVANLD